LKTIKYTAETGLKEFIETVMHNANPDYENRGENELTTSSINTAYALAIILLGEDQAIKLISRLRLNYTYTFGLTVEPGLSPWTFKVKNLFDGVSINRINKLPIHFEKLSLEQQNEQISTHTLQIRESLIESIQSQTRKFSQSNLEPYQKIEGFRNVLINPKFDFNQDTVDNLQKEIAENEANVTKENSFVYVIALASPALSKEKKFFDEDSMRYQHIFLLEQFSSSNGEVRYRRYQSMIEKATILEDFNSHKYGNLEEGTWSKRRLDRFFYNVQNALFTQ